MKANKKPRMTNLDVRMVIEEIESWSNGERGKKLTWETLEKIFSFTRQTMASKVQIKSAYNNASKTMKLSKSSGRKVVDYKTGDLEIMRLKNRIKELESEKEALLKLWINDFL